MSYNEAIADGIRIIKDQIQTIYYPRCQFCGDEVKSFNYIRSINYTCPGCRPMKRVLLKTGIFLKTKTNN